jgi:hypothetical protein
MFNPSTRQSWPSHTRLRKHLRLQRQRGAQELSVLLKLYSLLTGLMAVNVKHATATTICTRGENNDCDFSISSQGPTSHSLIQSLLTFHSPSIDLLCKLNTSAVNNLFSNSYHTYSNLCITTQVQAFVISNNEHFTHRVSDYRTSSRWPASSRVVWKRDSSRLHPDPRTTTQHKRSHWPNDESCS